MVPWFRFAKKHVTGEVFVGGKKKDLSRDRDFEGQRKWETWSPVAWTSWRFAASSLRM